MWTALRFISAWAVLAAPWTPAAAAQSQAQKEVPSHGAAVTALRAGMDGRLASASADGTIKVWAVESDTGSPQVLSDFPAWTHEAVLAPDASWTAAALAGGEIRVWTLPGRRLSRVLRAEGGEILCLAVSPDGNRLAAGGAGGEITLWSMPDGAQVGHIGSAHRDAVWDLEFSPDGKLLASGSKDETLSFWTSQGQAVKRVDRFDGPVAALAFQPGYPDRVAAASWDGRISRVEMRESDGKRKGRPDQALFRVRTLAFSPDGQRLAAGGDGSSLVLWDLETWPRSASFYFQGGGLQSLSFTSDGQLLAGGGRDHRLRFWDASGKLLKETPHVESGAFTSVAFLPDGKRLLTASWGSLDGASVKIRGPQARQVVDVHSPATVFQALAWSDQEGSRQLLAAAGPDPVLRVWDASGLLAAAIDTPAPVAALDLSPDGDLLAAGLVNGTVAVWKLHDHSSPAWTRSLHLGAATSLRFLSGGRHLAAGGRDGFLHLLEADSGASLWKLRHDFSITEIDADRPGTRLAWTTVEPAAAWVDLDLQGAQVGEPQALKLDTEVLSGLAVSDEGGQLAVASAGRLQLWRLPSVRGGAAVGSPTEPSNGATDPAPQAGAEADPARSSAQATPAATLPGQYKALEFLADGRLAAAATEARIEILETPSLQLERTLSDWSQPVLAAQAEARPLGRLDKASLSPLRLTAPQWCGTHDDGRCQTRNGLLLLRLDGPDFQKGARLDWRQGGVRVQHNGFVARGGTRFLPQGLAVELLPGHDLAAGDNLLIDHLALSSPASAFQPGPRKAWRWDEEQEEWNRRSLDMAMQQFPDLTGELEFQAHALLPGFWWLGGARLVIAYPAQEGETSVASSVAPGAEQPDEPAGSLDASGQAAEPDGPRQPGATAANNPVATAPAAARTREASAGGPPRTNLVQLDGIATPTFSTSVDLVNVLATVRDSSGRYLTGLQRDDFLLEEDGRPQQITYFSSDDEAPPLSVAVVIDTSESVKEKLPFERQAAAEFLRSVLTRSQDAAAVVEFGDTIKLTCDFSHDLDRLESALETVYVHGRTRLFDGIWLAVEDLLARRTGRRILVLVSDGNDTNSRLNAREAIRQAQDNEVLIFGIGVRASDEDSDFGQIRRLAESTGGLFFDSKADLERLRAAFRSILQAIAAQYSLGYAPQEDGTPGFRSLQVTVPSRRTTVTHRPGYHYEPPR